MKHAGSGIISILLAVAILAVFASGYFFYNAGGERDAVGVVRQGQDAINQAQSAAERTSAREQQLLEALSEADSSPHRDDREDPDAPFRPPAPETGPPVNLVLPFNLEDIDISEKLISPFGLIRHAKDIGHGHGGIDIPLYLTDEIYAPEDGVIVRHTPVTDGRGGDDVDILLKTGDRNGEGWVFLFEHILLDPGLTINSTVMQGSRIGQSAINHGANHMGLVYAFNNYQWYKDPRCWIDYLTSKDNADFMSLFNTLKTTESFRDPWINANQEGFYSYRGVMDASKYPNGPQPCYPYGLDARTPI